MNSLKLHQYKLTVGGFQGTTTDPMVLHNGMYFTTKDSNSDQWSQNQMISKLDRNLITVLVVTIQSSYKLL